MNENRVIGEKCLPLKGENSLNESGGPAGHLKNSDGWKASVEARLEAKAIREEMDDRMTPAKAIRSKCLDCAYTSHEVRWCPVSDCALWQWRFGRKPETTMRKEPEFLDVEFVKRGPGGES